MNAYCNMNGIGLIPWAPLAGGSLARPANTSHTTHISFNKNSPLESNHSSIDVQIIGRVEEVAKKHGKKMSQVAIAWITSKVASPIVGVSSMSWLEDSITTGFQLNQDEIRYLEEL